MPFITVLAWGFGIGASLLIVIRIMAAIDYSFDKEVRNAMLGKAASFSIVYPSIVAFVCWAWILTN